MTADIPELDQTIGFTIPARHARGRLVRLGRAAVTGQAPAGVYHGTSGGEASWYELAQETFRLLGTDPGRVRPTTSRAFVRPAPRPAYSVLGHERWRAAGIEPIRDWRAALAEAFPALHQAERESRVQRR